MTSSNWNRDCTSLAATRWPWWIGSKVPPMMPTRRALMTNQGIRPGSANRDRHEIIGVDDLTTLLRRQVVTRTAHHFRQFCDIVGHHTACDHPLALVDQIHHVTRLEVTIHAGDPRGQQ